jgi:hypothetical protein
MSLDTTTRINDLFKSLVATPNSLYTIYIDKNEGIEDDLGGGVYVRLTTESSGDEPTGTKPSDFLYTETGLFIVEILAPKSLGTLDLYSHSRVVTLIRDAFRNKHFRNTTGTQEGDLYFFDMTTSRTFEAPSRQGNDYMVKNAFINFQKNYRAI